MLVYKWPRTIIKDLDRACRNFIWTGDIRQQAPCSVKWAKVTTIKQEGGLGLKSFETMNEALLMKMAWRIVSSSAFGMKEMRAKYLDKFRNPTNARAFSSVWGGLRNLASDISKETTCRIGNGDSICFWTDDWLGYRLVDRLNVPYFLHANLRQPVSDYFYNGRWHLTIDFVNAFPLVVVDILLLPMEDNEDVRYWTPALHGVVTPKLAYIHRRHRAPVVHWGSWIWEKFIPVRRSLVLWRIMHNRLPLWDHWRSRGFSGPSICFVCREKEESMQHCFWDCDTMKVVWYVICDWFGVDYMAMADLQNFLVSAMARDFSEQLGNLWKVAVITCFWAVWNGRNNAMFEGHTVTSYGIMNQVLVAVREANSSFSLGCMRNSVKELFAFRSLGIAGKASVPREPRAVSWWPPRVGWFKVNTDGSADGAPGHIHAGGVFRDAGNVVHGCFHVYGGKGYAFEAELLALITALTIAEDRGWRKLWVESDSTYVVDLLKTRSLNVPWKFAADWKRVLRSLDSFDLQVTHIYREGNAVADIMARPSTPAGFWTYGIPIISEAVERDFSIPRFFRW